MNNSVGQPLEVVSADDSTGGCCPFCLAGYASRVAVDPALSR